MTKSIMVVAGKRKKAVAKVRISDGSGNITYNKLDYNLLPFFHRLSLQEPIALATQFLGSFRYDLSITTHGGGKEGQIQAARLGIAKALVQFMHSAELKKEFLKYDRNLLVADTRRKEPYKPGDSKARAKRQKSYR